MTANDDNFSKKLTGYLDQGTADLKAGTVYRLQNARAAALARLAEPVGVQASQSRLAHAPRLAFLQHTQQLHLQQRARVPDLVIAIIVAAAFGYQQWQVYHQVNEIVELDAQILSSDLPIDAYLDQGFRNWLTRDEN